jgi:hypothetical protein
VEHPAGWAFLWRKPHNRQSKAIVGHHQRQIQISYAETGSNHEPALFV